MQLSKQQLLSAGPKRKDVTIDAGTVTVRQFTAKETLRYMELQKVEKHDDVIAHILICGMAEPTLSRDDVPAILEMGGEVVSDLINEILILSKLKKPEDDEEKKTDVASSGATTTEDSSTVSA